MLLCYVARFPGTSLALPRHFPGPLSLLSLGHNAQVTAAHLLVLSSAGRLCVQHRQPWNHLTEPRLTFRPVHF